MAAGSSNSTFYSQDAMAFEDNFSPSLSGPSDHQQPCSSKSSANEKLKKGLSASPSAVKRSSRPATPVIQATPSPLICYAVRLKHGEELRRSLLNFVEKNELKAAFIMTCVGSAVSARLRPASAVPNMEGNYMLDLTSGQEIVSLEGTLSNGGHLHCALADVTGKVIGGHLLELIVDTTAEVVIGECTALAFKRTYDESTGFNELVVNNR